VFGRSFVRFCFDNVYVVVFDRIALIVLGCVQLCYECYVENTLFVFIHII
jgi:hypothetical protein